MNEHDKEVAFLRQCALYDEIATRRELEAEITGIQRDARCVRRAIWLMTRLMALAFAVFVYGVVMVDTFPYNMPPLVINIICVLAVSSLLSVIAFAGLGIVYRRRLREKSRLTVARLLESRLGKPLHTPSPDIQPNPGGANDSPAASDLGAYQANTP